MSNLLFTTPALLIGMPGGMELVVIVLFVLLFFGAKKIPELARGLGRGMYEFRKAADDIKKEIDNSQRSLDESTNPSSYNKTEEKNDKAS